MLRQEVWQVVPTQQRRASTLQLAHNSTRIALTKPRQHSMAANHLSPAALPPPRRGHQRRRLPCQVRHRVHEPRQPVGDGGAEEECQAARQRDDHDGDEGGGAAAHAAAAAAAVRHAAAATAAACGGSDRAVGLLAAAAASVGGARSGSGRGAGAAAGADRWRAGATEAGFNGAGCTAAVACVEKESKSSKIRHWSADLDTLQMAWQCVMYTGNGNGALDCCNGWKVLQTTIRPTVGSVAIVALFQALHGAIAASGKVGHHLR